MLTDALRKDMLMGMMTPDLKAQVDVTMLIVEDSDLDYAKLKRFIFKYIYRQLPPSNSAPGRDAHADGLHDIDNNGDEQVDAFGKGSRRDAKGGGGKGAPAGGGGTGYSDQAGG